MDTIEETSTTAHAVLADLPVVDLDPFAEDVLADPYSVDHRLREAGALFQLSRYGILGTARHAEVAAILADWQAFGSSRGVGLQDFLKEPPWRAPSLLLETDPPVHSQMRRLMNGVVSLPALKAVLPRWTARAEALVDALAAKRRFDGMEELAEVYPLDVFPDTIGIARDGREHLLPYAAAVFNAYGPKNAVWESTEVGLPDAVEWVNQACRRENLGPDGWGMQVYAAADRGECTEDEAHRLVRSFLSAGIDTTVSGIGTLLLALASHPDQWARLRAEPDLQKRAFDESLRWDSTAQVFCRTAMHDCTLGPVAIPQGTKILLFLGAANRDPRRWDNPDRFDVSRSSSGHVGFGFGIHQCLGQMVARQEAGLVLKAMLQRFATIRLAGAPERRLNNSLHPLARLPLEVTPA